MAERDWNMIEEQYRAGVISIGAICRANNVPRDKLMQKVRADGWNRSLSAEVQQEFQERLAFGENPDGEDAVTKAAKMQVDVILAQRKDISALRELVGKAAASLERILNGEPNNTDGVTVGRSGVVGALDTLGSVLQRLIPMERAAVGIGSSVDSGISAPGSGSNDGTPAAAVTFYIPQNHRNPVSEE